MKLTSVFGAVPMRNFPGIGKFAIATFVAGVMLAGSATAQLRHVTTPDEGRNYDARLAVNEMLVPAKAAPIQASTLQDMQSQIPDLMFYIDPDFGVTRTLYNMTGYLSEPLKGASHSAEFAGMDFVRANLAALGLQQEDLAEYRLTDNVFTKVTGATHIYWQQMHAGIPVYNAQLHVNINRDGRIISVNNLFVPGIANAVNAATPKLAASLAVDSVAQHLGVDLGAPVKAVASANGVHTFEAPALSLDKIDAQLVWVPVNSREVRLAWNFQVQTLDYDHWYDITVDAENGQVWTRFDWTNSGTYNVYKEPDESPLHGTAGRTLVSNPEDATASPNGWFTGGTMSGNNVTACPDISPANNACDSNPQCSGTTCNFSINLSQSPSNYIPAATANLFYWNNLIHDVQYQYGFDEAGGNFQENNFGNGGNGSDSVNADAQDGSGNCNANFSTPTDGGNPRMQMYTCTNASPARDGDLDNAVIVHEYGHGISIRQVGGPGNSSCLNNTQQPGEGWSDWFGLVYTAENGDAGTDSRGIGTYLFGQGPTGAGIRDLPYSTNNSINNWTYSSISGAGIPHGVGSRWAQAIWEVYWALVAKHGFAAGDQLITPGSTGSERALLYVNEGLKNTACSPTFLQTRDGIIQAATDNFGGADVCDVWTAFAAYGLGTDASTGGSGSTSATNGFNVPAACQCSPQPVADAGPDKNISAGGSTTIGTAAQAGTTYSWSPGGATTAQITVSPASTTVYTVTATTSCGSSQDSVTVSVAGQSSCPAGSIDFNSFALTSYSNQNVTNGTAVLDGGDTLQLTGNTWVRGTGNFTITADTVIEFQYASTSQGEIHGIGFDADDSLNDEPATFQFWGTQNWTGGGKIDWTPKYSGGGSFQTYTIPVGQYYTGSRRLLFANDKDSGTLNNNGSFKCVRIYEDSGPGGGTCAVDDDFEANTDNWIIGTSTCTTGTYVDGNPTQQVSTVVTQPNGSASGVHSIFTATNSSAGVNDVDGGNCVVETINPYVVAAPSTLSINWFHGQRDAGDDPSGDFFNVQYRVNGGSWVNVVSRGDVQSVAAWTNATAQVPAGNIDVRVQCSDGAGPGDIVECGIDDLSICEN
jgi:extracellular elastinolytic metalloproteinase